MKISQNGNQVLELFPFANNIKVNGSEKHDIKASENHKFPSFHESIGPVLAGLKLNLSHKFRENWKH